MLHIKSIYKSGHEAAKIAANQVDRLTVGIAVIRQKKILLVRRKQNDFLGGYYELPGGQVETNESLEQAAIRELKEETGLILKKIIHIVNGFDYQSKSGKTRQINFVVTVLNINNLPVLSSEHDQYIWANQKQIAALPMTNEMLKSIISLYKLQKRT